MAKRRVFISYSRKDGTPTAQRLRELLQEAGHEVWLDTANIGGGAVWSKVIEEALTACDVLVAVLTPASYVSEICRAEQIWALDKRKQVIPVLAVADTPVPIILQLSIQRRFPEQQTELLADIATEQAAVAPAERPLRYDTVPNLPQNYLIRAQDLDMLRDLVLAEGVGTNIGVTAIVGMGGVGKTVLAAALCRDVTVQRAFPDGIAWISVGREWDGDFVTRMRQVAGALGDDLSTYDSPLACENRYRTILREKAALVVMDDVWSLQHLQPLLVDAPRSRFLFTTRDNGIARAVTSHQFSVNALHENEARELLARWAGMAVTALPAEAKQVIQECGALAAAVAQVGASLRGLSREEWRDTLQALQRADISGIEDQLPTGQNSFFKSLAVSIDALPPQMRERYLKLAVLLEDTPAPLVVFRTLWKVNEAEGRRSARYFVERSLATWESDEPVRGIKLHPLQLDYVVARFADQPALQMIHGAVRLSSNVIACRPEEFAGQMVGRLLPHHLTTTIAAFLKDVAEGASRPWLNPLRSALHPPGTGLLRTLEGHSGPVYGLSLTPDGSLAVSASGDKTLKVWDLERGRELHTLRGHSASVRNVAVTPDGRRAVSASWDRTLKVWDLETGRELRTLEGHASSVIGVAVTPDGRRAVSASRDNTLKSWDLETGLELRTLEGHSGWIYGVTATPDGQRAVSASGDNTLKVWDLETGRELHTLRGHADAVNSAAVTPDGRRAVSASWDKVLKVWDLETGLELRTLTGHSASVYGVAVTQNGRSAVSASSDKTLKLWDLESGRELRALEGHSASVQGVAATPDGRRAVSASWDNTLNVWDLDNSSDSITLEGHSDCVNDVAVTSDGRRVVSASDDETLKIWDIGSGLEIRTLEGRSAAVHRVAVTADGRRAVSASVETTLKVWDLDSGRELRRLEGHSASVLAVAVTPDGRRAVSASGDTTLKVWDLESGRELITLQGHSASVRDVAVALDGRRAVSASWDDTLKVWDLESGREMRTLKNYSLFVHAMAVTPDGRHAVCPSWDNALKVWDLESGRELRTLEGHTGYVSGVAVSPEGRYAASVSEDKTLKVWDLETGEAIVGFTCDNGIRCCAFAGSDTILAGDRGGRLHFLRLET